MSDKRQPKSARSQSLRDRIRRDARAQAVSAQSIRRRDTIKRFLAHLASVDRRWLLKGAGGLESRIEVAGQRVAVRTRDLDLATREQAAELLDVIAEACRRPARDGFSYEIAVLPRSVDDPYAQVELTIAARLDGRRWDDFSIDISAHEPVAAAELDELSLGTNLDGEDLGAVPAQPLHCVAVTPTRQGRCPVVTSGALLRHTDVSRTKAAGMRHATRPSAAA